MATDQNVISAFASAEPAIAQRLLSPAMAVAWQRLQSMCGADDAFLCEYFVEALRLRQSWTRMSKAPTADLAKNVSELAAAAHALEIKILAHDADLRSMFGILEVRYHRAMAVRLRRFALRLRQRPGLFDDMAHRPRKPRAATAERTFCISALTRFLWDHLGRTEHQVVANTVSAILDLDRDSPLTANEVARLVKGV